MDFIEGQVVLPKQAGPLDTFRRYYHREGGKVIGLYIAGEKPGRQWVTREEAIGVMDGGCTVINVRLDTRSKRITASCNGLG